MVFFVCAPSPFVEIQILNADDPIPILCIWFDFLLETLLYQYWLFTKNY